MIVYDIPKNRSMYDANKIGIGKERHLDTISLLPIK
jgi:hypothetical protein